MKNNNNVYTWTHKIYSKISEDTNCSKKSLSARYASPQLWDTIKIKQTEQNKTFETSYL